MGKRFKLISLSQYIEEQINNLNIVEPIELFTEEATPKAVNLDDIYNEIHKDPVKCLLYTKSLCCASKRKWNGFCNNFAEQAKNLLNEDREEYTIPIKVVYPSITTNMIGTEAFPDLLSTFSTKIFCKYRKSYNKFNVSS